MRWWKIVAATGLVAGCIPHPHARRPSERPPAHPAQTLESLRQCQADLGRDDVRFKLLPDRDFGGGCSAIGTVQLRDIGIPTTNLGAMACPLALAFERWAREAVQPAARAWLGGQVAKIESFGTYSCRPVNGVAGNKLSEHARSNAVDVSGFVLADGRRITVLKDWNGADDNVRKFLRAVHDAGCRRFQVTLGPDANAFHYNHMHFDMGPYHYCK